MFSTAARSKRSGAAYLSERASTWRRIERHGYRIRMHLPLVSAPPVSASAILAEGHLTQAFDHAVIGASLTHVRRRHLALRQLTLTEIAFDVGFNDSNYFTRQFRKATGLSPRDYRLRLGGA